MLNKLAHRQVLKLKAKTRETEADDLHDKYYRSLQAPGTRDSHIYIRHNTVINTSNF